MALQGRHATPTKILEARGSWRAKKREGEPQYAAGVGPAPPHLNKEARAEWRRVSKQIETSGIGQRVDRAALAVYCEAWGEWVGLCDELAAGGLRGSEWRFKVAAKNDAARRVLATADRFGFSPAARARLKAPETRPAGDGEGKARFFRTTAG